MLRFVSMCSVMSVLTSYRKRWSDLRKNMAGHWILKEWLGSYLGAQPCKTLPFWQDTEKGDQI